VTEAHRIVVERLPRRQTVEDVGEHVGVGVKLGNAMPHVLLTGVAERLVIGPVGPEDGPVGEVVKLTV
jgi:hypothetical protein